VSVAVTIGLIAGLIVGLKREIQPIETLRWSSSKARDGMVLGLRRWSMAGLKYGACMALIAGLIYSIFDLDVGQPDDLALWRRGGQILGAISGASAVVFTLLVCSGGSSWIRLRGRLRTASIDGLTSALIVGIGWALSFGIRGEAAWHIVLWFLLTGLSVGAIAALGHGLRNRLPFRMTDVLIVALIGWVMSGLGTWFISTLIYDAPSQLRMSIWLSGWLGVAVTVGSVAALIATIREKERSGDLVQSGEREVWDGFAARCRQWLLAGVIAGLIWTVVLTLQMAASYSIRGVAMILISMVLALTLVLAFSALAVAAGVGGIAPIAALLGGLLGAIRMGLTGPEIERRTVPNQGIWRSARNVGIFAAIGAVILGPIWSVVNLLPLALITGLMPHAWGLLRSVLNTALFMGFVAALIPAAACIQHFTLRFVLWCRGLAPWNYTRFLDYATERMLLQRVGGRYRFMHDLLRDHFAALEPKRA
jgi:hypothetical protein